MAIFSNLTQALNFGIPGIDDAFRASVKAVLQGNMTYGRYRSAVTMVNDLRSLPLLYLLDQRVRPKPATWQTDEEIHEYLTRLLSVSKHPGALKLVTDALALDPRYDAVRLDRAREISPAFVRFCLEGRLRWAIDTVPEDGWPTFDRPSAFKLVADMLIYHAAFQVQLVAAGIWNIDHLFLALNWRAGRYDQNAAINDVETVASTIVSIGDHILGRKPRYPNSSLVVSLKKQAESWRDDTARTDAALRTELERFYAEINPHVSRLLAKTKKAKRRLKSLKGQSLGVSLHKAYYGVTANEALYFAVTGLCQLRCAAGEMVTAVANADGKRAWSIWLGEKIKLDDENRARLIFSWRATLVRDHKAPPLQDSAGNAADLAHDFSNANYSIMPGRDLIERAHASLQGAEFDRTLILNGAPSDIRRVDIIPEYLLQFQMLPTPDLPEVLPLSQLPDPVAIRNKRLDERSRNQPSPRYRAPKRAHRA